MENNTSPRDPVSITNKKDLSLTKGLNLDWLRYFVVYGETLNTSEASNKLSITRQALIKALKGLEDHLSVQLIKKTRYFSSLTEQGEIFFNKATKILQSVRDLENHFSDLDNVESSGSITLAYSSVWSYNHYLVEIISKFMIRYPSVYMKIYLMTKEEIERGLLKGEVDLALLQMTDSMKKHPDIDYLKGEKINFVIVSKPQKKRSCYDFSYILPGIPINNESHTKIQKQSEEDNIKMVAETNSALTALDFCETGICAAFVPEIIVRDRISRGTLAIVADPVKDQTLSLYMAKNKNIQLNKTCTALIKEIKHFMIDI